MSLMTDIYQIGMQTAINDESVNRFPLFRGFFYVDKTNADLDLVSGELPWKSGKHIL